MVTIKYTFPAILGILILGLGAPVQGERLKDLSDVEGNRPNQLVGYGLVVGLAGTGDDQSAKFSSDSVVNMLERLGTNIDTNQLRLRNVAGVMVTAELPAFSAPGQRIDVTVSSMGTAKSLEGGTLLLTPLKGVDRRVYVVAQGALSVGGFLASAQSGGSVQKNHPTVGRIPAGGLIERGVAVALPGASLKINLRRPDFTTSVRIAEAIEKKLRAPKKVEVADKKGKRGRGKNRRKKGKKEETVVAPLVPEGEEPYATPQDPGTVLVRVPHAFKGRIAQLVAELEMVQVTPDVPTKVVINERTGTVVLGQNVRITPVAIAHGGLTVEVQENPTASQPNAFSEGTTQVLPGSAITVKEGTGQLHTVREGASLSDVVGALNALGVTPRDLVAILQTLKSSGALSAELEIQ
ncbi:MAG: flagellar basal body P-ring protein FlgI [Myxococcota bacterium]|nr:flagellar basal body P-ring protein FlgI [Myxococcota bacterium]